MEYKIKQIITHVQFIPGSFGNVSRKGGQALSPHGEETYKDLTYLNDAYKRAIIKSQEQEEISFDVKNSLNASYDIQPLKMQKTKQLLEVGEQGKHCKAELVPFVGLQNMVRVRVGVGVGSGG